VVASSCENVVIPSVVVQLRTASVGVVPSATTALAIVDHRHHIHPFHISPSIPAMSAYVFAMLSASIRIVIDRRRDPGVVVRQSPEGATSAEGSAEQK
jgi:hypothetical protein